jgi:hypothetical protein
MVDGCWVVDGCRVVRGRLGMIWSWVIWGRLWDVVRSRLRVVGSWVNWDRLGVDHWEGVWLGCRVVWCRLGMVGLWGVCHPLVLDVGDVSVLMVGVVGDDLGPAVGEGNTVLAGNHAVVILSLLLVEKST